MYLELLRHLLVDHRHKALELPPHAGGVSVGLDEPNVGLHKRAFVLDPVPEEQMMLGKESLKLPGAFLVLFQTALSEAGDIFFEHIRLITVSCMLGCGFKVGCHSVKKTLKGEGWNRSGVQF